MCKKVFYMILCLSLIVVMIPSNTITVFAEEINNNINADSEVDIDNKYNKIHFYFDVEEHTTINDECELAEAISSLKDNTLTSMVYET